MGGWTHDGREMMLEKCPTCHGHNSRHWCARQRASDLPLNGSSLLRGLLVLLSSTPSCKNVADGAGRTKEVFWRQARERQEIVMKADHTQLVRALLFADAQQRKDDTCSNGFLRTNSQTKRGERGQDSSADGYQTNPCSDSDAIGSPSDIASRQSLSSWYGPHSGYPAQHGPYPSAFLPNG